MDHYRNLTFDDLQPGTFFYSKGDETHQSGVYLVAFVVDERPRDVGVSIDSGMVIDFPYDHPVRVLASSDIVRSFRNDMESLLTEEE